MRTQRERQPVLSVVVVWQTGTVRLLGENAATMHLWSCKSMLRINTPIHLSSLSLLFCLLLPCQANRKAEDKREQSIHLVEVNFPDHRVEWEEQRENSPEGKIGAECSDTENWFWSKYKHKSMQKGSFFSKWCWNNFISMHTEIDTHKESKNKTKQKIQNS